MATVPGFAAQRDVITTYKGQRNEGAKSTPVDLIVPGGCVGVEEAASR